MANPFDKDWSKPEVKVDVNVTVNQPKKNEKKKPYADVTIVLDRSASMLSMKQAVVDGFNQFIKRMRETPGDTRWSLVQFDDPDSARGSDEPFPNTVFKEKTEGGMEFLKPDDFKPRGATALVDAVCKTMRDIDNRVSGQRHITPIMMIVTDGEENSSKEFTSEKMREMIARRESKGWNFQYLGANQDAWGVAKQYDIARHTSYTYSCDVTSGGLAAGSVNSFGFKATAAGFTMGLSSGMTGLFHMVSGCVGSGYIG